MKIMSITGARPNFIKMSPIIREIEKKGLDHVLVHTGQHYDTELSQIFLDDLNFPPVDYYLSSGSGTHGVQTGKILMRLDKVILKEKPDIVLVPGDTNTTLAGALSAVKLNVPVGHIEAGARYRFEAGLKHRFTNERIEKFVEPEQINRAIIDRISDFLFCATKDHVTNLIKEGIPDNKIYFVTDVMVDAFIQNLDIALKKSKVLEKYNLARKEYVLLTQHHLKPDVSVNIKNLEVILDVLSEQFDKVFFPVHPRMSEIFKKIKKKYTNVFSTQAIGYLDFLSAVNNAKLVVTDSGGVQKEAVMSKIPCILTLNDTEWREGIDVGAMMLAGWMPSKEKLLETINILLNRDLNNVINPFGDGKASERVVNIIIENIGT